MINLWIIVILVALVFIISRLIALAVLRWHILPRKALSNGHRPHHFVYGNILIVLTSFLVIGLGVDTTNVWIAIAYGLGLGLVLDEFPHWLGNVKELTRNTPVIPGALPAVIIVEVVLLVVILLKALSIL